MQGYAGLGPAGRQFNGQFLRYAAVTITPTTLTVRNLPPHTSVSVKFLLALIDSWDGAELMQISVDGVTKFNHWFQLALGDTTDYTPAPPGSAMPNPARAEALRLRFALASSAPATLELFNVAGRRVATRDVARFGAGEHEATFATQDFAPVVYVARLTQASAAQVRRVVLLP